ncbi:sugar phosphate nucleotidyltransferase [Pseudokineococcus basanitobsidens]|uniref:Sugar phosphate nucleotidyltransferase n=1 Tax=Pseudokineococcus basanitobsidens TaxID=1926649 RepID=A0ABU8RH54_9ACTN
MSPAGVVLAAGAGTRLAPLTHLRPKALCPVGGRPLLDHALDRLVAALPAATADPPAHLAVNAHAHAGQVVRAVGGRAHVAVEAPVALGTAGALGGLRDWLDGRDVVVTNADAWLPEGLDGLLDGWDGERCRLLVQELDDGPGDPVVRPASRERPVRYVGACVLPGRLVRALAPVPSGLLEVLWRAERDAGRLDLHRTAQRGVDCGTPGRYLAANLAASGGRSVIGAGAVVDGELERCVVWDGAVVGAGEHLVDVVRAGDDRHRVTVGGSSS